MTWNKIISLTFFAILSFSVFAQSPEDAEAYIEQYKKLAVKEQVRNGVPAAITLAQGIHESACGKSMLATEANNHFGIKCKTTWKGETILHDDDAKQECFRKYSNAEQSFIDHSNFLKDNNRYHFLFDIEVTDYKAWASGLKRAGYATNPAYVSGLTDLIEKYNLQQFTYQGLNQTFQTPQEVVPEQDKQVVQASSFVDNGNPDGKTQYYKGLKGFWAQKGDKLMQQAVNYNIRYPRLLLLNDLSDAPLEYDQFIFIDKKRKVGTSEFHVVQAGEDMHYISQLEAMMLDNLYAYNNLHLGQEPMVGERLNMQYKSYDTPKLRIAKDESASALLNEGIQKKEERIKSTPVKKIDKQDIPTELEPVRKVTPNVATQESPSRNVEEQTSPKPIVVQEIKPSNATPQKQEVVTQNITSSPIIDEEKAKAVEAMLATDNKKEVEKLADQAALEKEEQARKEREMMERIQKNDAYANSITQKIDEDRKKQEVLQDEEIKKRREMEDKERFRIEQEQIERERVEAEKNLQVQKTAEMESIQAEKARLEREAAEKLASQQAENERLAAQQAEQIRLAELEKKKRKYNDPGVSDSVKDLKRKFDDIVYRPLPERNPVVVYPKQDSVAKPVIKPVISKPKAELPKKENAVTSPTVKKGEVKKDNVAADKKNIEKTTTGVKRNLNAKKEDDKKVNANDKVASSKEVAKDKSKTAKKKDVNELSSKAKDKKETTKKKVSDKAKETAKDKKAVSKKEDAKKTKKK